MKSFLEFLQTSTKIDTKKPEESNIEQLRNTLNQWMNTDQDYSNPTDRHPFQQKVWSFIQKNIDAITNDMGEKKDGDYPSASYAAWVLVQHMDNFPEWQKEFLQKFPKTHKRYKFLYDRVAVNEKVTQFASQKLYGCDNPKFKGNPLSGIRDTSIFPQGNPKSAQQALQHAIDQGNTCLAAAVQHSGATTQPSYNVTEWLVLSGLREQNLDVNSVIQQYLNSDIGKKYQNYDCKSVTRAFIQWAESNGMQAQALHLAPPSAEFLQKNPQFKGKSGTGDSHIMPVINGYAVDFTARQFGMNRPYNNPLITPISQVQSVYGKFGYYTDSPDWFNGGKSSHLGSWKSMPTIDTNFQDDIL